MAQEEGAYVVGHKQCRFPRNKIELSVYNGHYLSSRGVN
jgi:hypothetical protein